MHIEEMFPTREQRARGMSGLAVEYVEAVHTVSQTYPGSRAHRRARADVRALMSRVRTLALVERVISARRPAYAAKPSVALSN